MVAACLNLHVSARTARQPVDGGGAWRGGFHDIAHRDAREAQIVAALGAGPATVPEVVARVYTDVPKVLHKAAELSVSSHLLKLRDEGRAESHGADDARKATWRLVSDEADGPAR